MQRPIPSQAESDRLGELIRKLKNSGPAGEYDLLVEHLQSALACLLGAMPEECEHNLGLGLNAAAGVSSEALRKEIRERVAALSREIGASRPTPRSHPRIPSLKEYFPGSGDVSFGIFYPKKHVVAVLPRLEDAESGRRALHAAGFRIWEAIAVPGEEVEKWLEEMKENRTLWEALMVELSKVLDTEIGLMDRYARWAHARAGFLMAYSATEGDAEEITRIVRPFGPLEMHWFMPGYIQHLLPTG